MLEARIVRALAHELGEHRAEARRGRVDPLVHLTEKRLIARRALLTCFCCHRFLDPRAGWNAQTRRRCGSPSTQTSTAFAKAYELRDAGAQADWIGSAAAAATASATLSCGSNVTSPTSTLCP